MTATTEHLPAQGHERLIKAGLFVATLTSVAITTLIIASVLTETLTFFSSVSPASFFFGTEWSPQTALRADQAGSSGLFGAVPVFLGTLMVTIIAMMVATPLGLMAAIYLSVYATERQRAFGKPLLEILAGVPSVVYGYFAILTVAPFIRAMGETLGLSIASESALVAGSVMGIMITPYVMSLSEDAMSAVPQSLSLGSLAMGATKSETIRRVLIPSSLTGVISAVLLGTSRGIGETMIVVMAAGLAANLTANPLESVTTATVQIVTLLVGDHEFDSDKTRAAFALGFTLFIITLFLNLIALVLIRKLRTRHA